SSGILLNMNTNNQHPPLTPNGIPYLDSSETDPCTRNRPPRLIEESTEARCTIRRTKMLKGTSSTCMC
mgnify:CR=1